MDKFVTVPVDLREVFGRLVEPRNLGRWLPAMKQVQPEPGVVGVPFEVLLRDGRGWATAQGELVVCEPPRLAVWRFDTSGDVVVVHLTCNRVGDTTRVHVHQDDQSSRHPLDVDLDTLRGLLSRHTPESLHTTEGDHP